MELLNYKTLLLILNLVTGQWCQKMLSELKKCGDPECEGTISRVQAKRDFKGPDCRYLTFKAGAVIFVYYKLSGKRDDLWAGSIDKEFGYFPKDAVNLEEEYVSKNVDIPTKETDFLCLNGEEYTAESEDDSEFIENFDTRLSGNPNTEHEIKDYFPDAHLQNHMHVSFQGSQPKSVDHQITGSVNGLNQELERKNIHGYVDLSDTLNDREVKSDAKRQDTDNSYVDSSWIGSHVKGWLGVGKNEGQKDKPVTESLRDNSFKSRKITLVDELKEEDEKVESGPEKSSWFGGGVTEFLGFGKKTAEPDIVSETQTDITSRDFVSENGVHQKEDSTEILNAHMLTDSQIKQTEEVMHKSENVQLKQVPNNEESKSSWFNVDLGSMLNFGQTTGKIPDASSIQPKAEIIAASEENLQKTAEKLITSADTLQHTKEDDTMPDDSLQQDKTKEYEISGNSLPQYKTEKDVISDSTHLQHKTEEFTSQNNQEVFITDDESKRDTKENKEKSGILNNDDTQKTDIETKEKSRWQYMNIANLINLGGSQHEKNEFQNAVKKKECPDMYEKGASEEHKDKQQIEESVYKSKDQPEFTVLENMAKASETSFGNAQTEEKKDGIQQYENDAKRAPDQSLFSTKTVHHEHTSLKTPLKQHQKSIHQPKPDTVSQVTLEQTSHEYLGNITPSRNDASLQSVSQISEDAVSHTDEKNTSYQNIWNIFDMISILRPNWTKLQSSTKKLSLNIIKTECQDTAIADWH
ncbi:melanoma inhibitory activity protein 2-like [Protopterus annectens]|uniref:melanoma inhibitory activity protein 2-like n=1 Tax=Protopterus annectens TaxID=7888 RepID=UPI001CFA584C|nr:melanoma inhibitory activity protein 2-like [Protopterus annectens]